MADALVRKVGESGRTFSWDFKRFPEIVAGDSLSTVNSVSSTPAGQTLGTPSISGTLVQVTVTGTTTGVYTMTCVATTVGGQPLESTYPMNVVP